MTDIAEYWARDTAAAGTFVAPVPAANVTSPAPSPTKSMDDPMGKATAESCGSVTVMPAALVRVTSVPRSARTGVYVVPVWLLTVWYWPPGTRHVVPSLHSACPSVVSQ